MTAHATRAFIALAGDYCLCPLPQVQLADHERGGRGAAAPVTERRPVVCSVHHAEAAEAALRSRVAKAKAQVEASTGVAEVAGALKRSQPFARR